MGRAWGFVRVLPTHNEEMCASKRRQILCLLCAALLLSNQHALFTRTRTEMGIVQFWTVCRADGRKMDVVRQVGAKWPKLPVFTTVIVDIAKTKLLAVVASQADDFVTTWNVVRLPRKSLLASCATHTHKIPNSV